MRVTHYLFLCYLKWVFLRFKLIEVLELYYMVTIATTLRFSGKAPYI